MRKNKQKTTRDKYKSKKTKKNWSQKKQQNDLSKSSSKAISSEIGKKLINRGIDNIPNIFKFGVSKIKTKNVKRAMESDIADMLLEEAVNRLKNKYENLFD